MGKSRKGGYKLVSLQLIELTTMTACAGLYGAIVNSHDKPLMLDDIKINGEKKNALYVKAVKGTNKYTIKGIYGYILEVTNQDAVTISQDAEGIELPVPEIADAGKVVGVNASGEYELQTPRTDAQVKSLAKDEVEDAESGTIVNVLGLNEDGDLVKDALPSAGTKLYKHTLKKIVSTDYVTVTIINNTPSISQLQTTTLDVYLQIAVKTGSYGGDSKPIVEIQDLGSGQKKIWYFNEGSIQGVQTSSTDWTISSTTL